MCICRTNPNTTLLTVLLILSSNLGVTQNITPVTQNIAGYSGYGTSNFTLTFSVGEMASIVHYIGTDKSTLSTGFLQSFTPIVTGIDELVYIKPGAIIIAPNPVINLMHLTASFLKPGQFEFNIVDASSNLKYQSIAYTIYEHLNTTLDIQNYVSGVYYIRVLFKPNIGAPEYGIYKIIKL